MLTEVCVNLPYRQDTGIYYRVAFMAPGGRVMCERCGDGARLELSLDEFKRRFSGLDPKEEVRLLWAEPLLRKRGIPADRASMDAMFPTGRMIPPGVPVRDAEVQEGGTDGGGDAAQPETGRKRSLPDVGVLVTPSKSDDLAGLVLSKSTRDTLDDALRLILRRDDFEAVWRLGEIFPLKNRCALNFYGAPGTGKSTAARGLALRLGRSLYQVDYAKLTSKWVGETDKYIKFAFEHASQAGALLLFEEADSILSRRMADPDQSYAVTLNQNRNVLMQELDRFDGIVVFATNLFSSYDAAVVRRISHHVEFPMPDEGMRLKLFRRHLPNLDRVVLSPEEWDRLATASHGLSGGDILNVCINAMVRASAPDDIADWKLTFDLLAVEMRRIQRTKKANVPTRRFSLDESSQS